METYNGHVRTPADAIILFEACRLGLLPRVQRRLSEKERQSITSGSIFVWDEREAGMRRWTDGKSWSASRVSGSFLTYREMEGKRGGGSLSGRPGNSPDHGSDSDSERGGEDGPDGYRYKPDGLMKQSFSITTSNNQKLHLISYYSRSHPNSATLNQPSNDPKLRHIRPQPGMYPESTVHEQQNVPVMSQRSSLSSQYSPSHPRNGFVRGSMSGASHDVMFNPPSLVAPSYGWPPSPISTPPTLYPGSNTYSHVPSLPLPMPPHHSLGNGLPPQGFHEGILPALNPQLPPNVAGNYDRPGVIGAEALLNHSAGRTASMASPRTMHLHPHSSPRMPYIQHGTSPITPADVVRYSSSGASAPGPTLLSGGFAPRSSSRQGEAWDIPGPLPAVDATAVPNSKSLDVQDIPNNKLGFREDSRALRQLDRAFIH